MKVPALAAIAITGLTFDLLPGQESSSGEADGLRAQRFALFSAVEPGVLPVSQRLATGQPLPWAFDAEHGCCPLSAYDQSQPWLQ